MNVFILCTGRTGSTTFVRACKHITNFSSGHETRAAKLGEDRLQYDDWHIEADNRLSWFLGRMDKKYGDDAFYIHLVRDRNKTIRSVNQRWYVRGAIVRAFCKGILMRSVPMKDEDLRYSIAEDYCDTVNDNIEHFLKDKTQKMTVHLETIKDDFKVFWNKVGAEGNLTECLNEFDVRHNKDRWAKYRNLSYMTPVVHLWRRMKLLAYNLKGSTV